MNLSTRIARLEKLEKIDCGQISIAVLDRILDDTISEQEFHRLTPLFEEVLATPSAKAERN
jgi:hypothetical protein